MARTGVGVRVYIDNNVLDDGSINANSGISADDNLNVTWGRAVTTEQPEASTCTFRVTDIPGNRYFDHFKIGSTVAVYAVGMSYDAAGPVEVRYPVFGGRITDMSSAAAGEYPQIDITAVDFQAELENRFIGDVPWNTSATRFVDKRAARVLELAAAAGDDRPFILIVDDDLKHYSLVPDDVDHRAAWGILHDMAISVDAVLWSGVQHNDAPFIRYEDPNSRPSMNKLGLNDENEVVIQPLDPEHWPEERRPIDIDACEILRNPVTFTQNVSDIATRISLQWNKEEYNEAGSWTGDFIDATETLIDTAREEQYGTRSISVQTLLAFQPLAPPEIAERTLARLDGRWRIEGVEIADAYLDNPNWDTAKKLYALLDNERRQGLAIRFGNLPAWSPFGKAVSAYLEGGEYRFVEGGWELALNVSTATGAGATIPWNQVTEPWPWDQFAENVTWGSLRGVGGVE